MTGIIDNILEFSKFESDKVKLEHEPFDLGAVVDELEDILTPLTHKKQTELIFDCGSEVPVFLRGDPFRLRQILINLVRIPFLIPAYLHYAWNSISTLS